MSKSKLIWEDSAIATEILKRIEGLILTDGDSPRHTISPQGYTTKFDGSMFNSYLAILGENISPNDIPINIHKSALKKSIYDASEERKLNIGYVSNLIKEEEKVYRQQEVREFWLVTAISITGLNKKLKTSTKYAQISISKSFPRDYKKNYDFNMVKRTYPNLDLKRFSWVVVKVSSRCE